MRLGYILTVFAVCMLSFMSSQQSEAQKKEPKAEKQDLKPIINSRVAIYNTVDQVDSLAKDSRLNILQILRFKKRPAKSKAKTTIVKVPVIVKVPFIVNADSSIPASEYFAATAKCDTIFIHDTLIIKKKRRPLINIKF